MSGGNTLFRGMPKRVEKEIKWRAPAKVKVKLTAP